MLQLGEQPTETEILDVPGCERIDTVAPVQKQCDRGSRIVEHSRRETQRPGDLFDGQCATTLPSVCSSATRGLRMVDFEAPL